MQFDKDVLFLGMVSNHLQDGGVYYTVQVFDQGSGPVSVNVMDNPANRDIIASLQTLKFGSPCVVSFVLRPKDKLYRLGITHVSF